MRPFQPPENAKAIRRLWRLSIFAAGVFGPLLKLGQFMTDHGEVNVYPKGAKLDSLALGLNTLEAVSVLVLTIAIMALLINYLLLTSARFLGRGPNWVMYDVGVCIAVLLWMNATKGEFLYKAPAMAAAAIFLLLLIQKFIFPIQLFWAMNKQTKYIVCVFLSTVLNYLWAKWDASAFFGNFSTIQMFEWNDWLGVVCGLILYGYMVWYFYSFIEPKKFAD